MTAPETPVETTIQGPDGEVTLTSWTDGRGRGRLKWTGRKGFPVMLRKDETPEQAYRRTLDTEAAKAANPAAGAQATGAKPPRTKLRRGRRGAPTVDSPPDGGAPPVDPDRARAPGSDPKPNVRPAGRARPSETDLVRVWSELLTLPAIPMSLPVRDPSRDIDHGPIEPGGPSRIELGFRPRCEFCRDHFLNQGAPTALELVKLSRDNDPLRRVLEQVSTAWGLLATGGALVTYAAKPLMHHLAPEQALNSVGPVLGIPPRDPSPVHTHGHAHAPGTASAAAGAA